MKRKHSDVEDQDDVIDKRENKKPKTDEEKDNI